MMRIKNPYSSFRSKALIYFFASLELHSGSPEISSAVEDGMGGYGYGYDRGRGRQRTWRRVES